MYDELIEELRQHHCDAKEDDTQEVCEECAYDVIIADKSAPSGIASVCVCGLMNRAADAIEELEKQRDEWESHAALAESFAQGWIPVTERLPEYGEKCLVHFKLTGHNDFYISVSYCYVQKEGFWSDCGRDYKVTHWMPLPQPPEDDET